MRDAGGSGQNLELAALRSSSTVLALRFAVAGRRVVDSKVRRQDGSGWLGVTLDFRALASDFLGTKMSQLHRRNGRNQSSS